MANLKYDKEITALLVIDPYNDFISEGGKIWNRLKTVAEANDCIPHMLRVLNAARKAELRVVYALHRRQLCLSPEATDVRNGHPAIYTVLFTPSVHLQRSYFLVTHVLKLQPLSTRV
jgi:nicotinamidase-related amidase